MNVLFATPECAPMVKTGGLGDVSAALPRALRDLGHSVVTLMPAYSGMLLDGTVSEIAPIAADGPWPAAQLLRMHTADGSPLILLSCPALYGRADSPYDTPGGTPAHAQALRFGMLSRVAALLGTPDSPIDWKADVVHANDWPCGLAPLYLHAARQRGAQDIASSVLTIHNLAFQGNFPMEACDVLALPERYRGIDGVEFWGQLSMLKGGMQFCDALTTVSPTYAREIQQSALGFGLDGVLRHHAEKLHGLLNGIDTAVWSPSSDSLITANYDVAELKRKAINKSALRAHCGLPGTPAPLFGMVGRLTEQKGVDLVVAGAARFLACGAQLVVLGKGDSSLEKALASLAAKHPDQVHVTLGFDERLAHQIEAGADCFLMPSRFEPCGLNQMYSQAYGTPPVVTATGGLADTVEDFGPRGDRGTGFVMNTPTQDEFDRAVDRVLAAWAQPVEWKALQQRGMQRDFSWRNAAVGYSTLYELLRSTAAEASSEGASSHATLV